MKIKSIVSPTWLTRTILFGSQSKQGAQGQQKKSRMFNNKQNKPVDPAGGDNKKSTDKDGLHRANLYAKSMYMAMYCNTRTANITMAVTRDTLDMDKFLG